jgi:hypothetical protein
MFTVVAAEHVTSVKRQPQLDGDPTRVVAARTVASEVVVVARQAGARRK